MERLNIPSYEQINPEGEPTVGSEDPAEDNQPARNITKP